MYPVTSVGLTLHHAAVNIFIYGNTEMNKDTLILKVTLPTAAVLSVNISHEFCTFLYILQDRKGAKIILNMRENIF